MCNAVYLFPICARRNYGQFFPVCDPRGEAPTPSGLRSSDPPGAANDSPNGGLRCEYPFIGKSSAHRKYILRSADAAKLQGRTVSFRLLLASHFL